VREGVADWLRLCNVSAALLRGTEEADIIPELRPHPRHHRQDPPLSNDLRLSLAILIDFPPLLSKIGLLCLQ